MTLDFYSGALMAIDSAKALGLNINVKIYENKKEIFSSQKKETLIAQQKLDLFQRNFFLLGGGILSVLLFAYMAFRFKKYRQKQKIKNTIAVKDAGKIFQPGKEQ